MTVKTNKTIDFKTGNFRLNGSPFFLYSGEVHYFRIPKKDWTDRLRKLKAAGFNTVSSYVPWIWHEPEEGRFDFTGETSPERDVAGFADLAAKEDLLFLARIGPVSNAELKNEGIPAWLLRKYPEVFVTGTRDVGNLPHVTMLSYLHPVFQEKTGLWYAKLLPEIEKRQVTRGGNIIGVQLCNEVAMVHWLQKGADHKEHVNNLYRAFLKESYGNIQKLNKAYGTEYVSFDDIKQPNADHAELSKLPTLFDWALFYRRYYATYFLTLSSRAKKGGIDVPLYCNIPQFYDYDVRGRGVYAPMTSSMFRDFPLLTPNLIFGGAYQLRHIDFENFHDFVQATEVIRVLNTARPKRSEPLPNEPAALRRLPALPECDVVSDPGIPVVCAELQTGIMRDRPRIYSPQTLLHLKSSVAQGLAGINTYMFAGGKNPGDLGAFGTYHDWQAPVGPEGDLRPHYQPLKEFGQFLSWAGPLLAQTRKAVDTALGFYLPYYSTEYWSGPWVEKIENQRTAFWYDGLARLLQLAGFSYSMADLLQAPAEVLQKYPSLWVYSLDFMDRETQEKLATYVRHGGKLALYPRLPTMNLEGKPETILADTLGLRVSGELPGNLFSQNGCEHWVQGPIQLYQAQKTAGKSPEVKTFVQLAEGAPVLKKQVERGEALLIGFGLPHVYDHFRDWVHNWATSMGLEPRLRSEPWDMPAVLRENDSFGFVFVFNYHFTPREAAVTLALSGMERKIRLPRRGKIFLEPFSAAILPLNVPLSHGQRILYSTAEPRHVRSGPKQLEMLLATVSGHRYEIALQLPWKPSSVRLDGKKVSCGKGGECHLEFSAQGPETKISIR